MASEIKEQDYILAGDMRTCYILKENLRHLIPDNNFCIPKDEHEQVFKILNGWLVKMRQNLKITDDDHEI